MAGVIRLDPHNPTGEGLKIWEVIPPDWLIGPVPDQRGVKAFEYNGLCTGTWENHGGSATGSHPYPLFELMQLIDGEVTIIDEAGKKDVISAGQAFFLPQGFNCAWDMTKYYRKYFMTFHKEDYPAETDQAKLKCIRLISNPTDAELDDVSKLTDGLDTLEPHQRQNLAYESSDGRIQVGTLVSGPCEIPIKSFNRNEFFCVQNGTVIVTSPDREETFTAGESFFVPLHASVGWRLEGEFRAYFFAVWP
ncbi:cupin domain-containing protein [Hoeflea sp. TYP-13]|uniref:cupin domain-containing protein n=1 Tax=Hoeflea sp. TYP-13 TaxID=3230023 RepID=UPI0034C6213A